MRSDVATATAVWRALSSCGRPVTSHCSCQSGVSAPTEPMKNWLRIFRLTCFRWRGGQEVAEPRFQSPRTFLCTEIDTEVPRDYSGRKEWRWDQHDLCHAQEEVSPEQKIAGRKQEETRWVKGVGLGEVIAANLKSQAAYPLCPG